MEDNLKKKWRTNQSTKINLIGCNTIVNSPSVFFVVTRGKQNQLQIFVNKKIVLNNKSKKLYECLLLQVIFLKAPSSNLDILHGPCSSLHELQLGYPTLLHRYWLEMAHDHVLQTCRSILATISCGPFMYCTILPLKMVRPGSRTSNI